MHIYCSLNRRQYHMVTSGTWLDDPGFEFRQKQQIYRFSTRPDLSGAHIPLYSMVPGAPLLMGEAAGSEADPSPPCSTEVKNDWSYTWTLLVRLHGVQRDSLLPFVIVSFLKKY